MKSPNQYTKSSDPPWLRDLRNKVRARLRQQGATQAGLAWHLGITPKHITQLLTGTVTGTPEMLDRLARSVGLKIVLAEGDPAPALPSRRTSRRRKPREADPTFEEAIDGREAP
jgi:transcriptional regulator with XRE-family HTH domain